MGNKNLLLSDRYYKNAHKWTMRITNCYFVCFIVFIEFVNTDIGIGGQIPNIQRLNNQFPRSSKELIETAREENNITAADCHQLADNEQCPCLIRDVISIVFWVTDKEIVQKMKWFIIILHLSLTMTGHKLWNDWIS